jgi:hypothetical protein
MQSSSLPYSPVQAALSMDDAKVDGGGFKSLQSLHQNNRHYVANSTIETVPTQHPRISTKDNGSIVSSVVFDTAEHTHMQTMRDAKTAGNTFNISNSTYLSYSGKYEYYQAKTDAANDNQAVMRARPASGMQPGGKAAGTNAPSRCCIFYVVWMI